MGTMLFSLRANRYALWRRILLLIDVTLALAIYYVMFALVWGFISLRLPAQLVLTLSLILILVVASIRWAIYFSLRNLLGIRLSWQCAGDRYRQWVVHMALARIVGFTMVLCALSIVVVLVAQIGVRFDVPLTAYGLPPLTGLLETTSYCGLWFFVSLAGLTTATVWLHTGRDTRL